MSSNRLEVLKSMVEQDPGNRFARYGLAMEYRNSGDLAQALAEFRGLLEADPGYTAAYYHCGQALELMGRTEQAAAVYRDGIEACTAKGDLHTRSEIQAALDLLG